MPLISFTTESVCSSSLRTMREPVHTVPPSAWTQVDGASQQLLTVSLITINSQILLDQPSGDLTLWNVCVLLLWGELSYKFPSYHPCWVVLSFKTSIFLVIFPYKVYFYFWNNCLFLFTVVFDLNIICLKHCYVIKQFGTGMISYWIDIFAFM